MANKNSKSGDALKFGLRIKEQPGGSVNLSEKVSVNMNTSTLSLIDLLVDNGYYSNRSDFINQAVRQHLDQKQSMIDHIIENETAKKGASSEWFIGVMGINRNYLEQIAAENRQTTVSGYGLLSIAEDCPDELVFSVITDIAVRGRVSCRQSIKEHYGLK